MGARLSVAVLSFTTARQQAAAALEAVAAGDPEVHVDIVDAVTPPAILLVWEDPWLEPSTYGPELFYAQLTVLCVAARLEPGPGVETLEGMVELVVSRLAADAYPWPQASSQAPRVFEIAGVSYLGARVTYRLPIQIGA